MYRKKLNESDQQTNKSYTNDLHEALLKKDGTTFWRCWRSKFECNSKCKQVEGCVDDNNIANKLVDHFKNIFTCNDEKRAAGLKAEYLSSRPNYCGSPIKDSYKFDTELVSTIVGNLKHGKAVDIDGLSVEHLQYSHPSICVILFKLFRVIMLRSIIPIGFTRSYIVPIPKPKDLYSKPLTCDDFRGIAMSSVLAKVFEHCILDRFASFFSTSFNQFGFKKGIGCNHAIRSVRNIVDSFNRGGSTGIVSALLMCQGI